MKYTNPKSGDTPPTSIHPIHYPLEVWENCVICREVPSFPNNTQFYVQFAKIQRGISISLLNSLQFVRKKSKFFAHLEKKKEKISLVFPAKYFLSEKPYVEISSTFVCLRKNSFQFYLNRRKRIQIYIKLTAFYIYFLQIYLQMWAKKIH